MVRLIVIVAVIFMAVLAILSYQNIEGVKCDAFEEARKKDPHIVLPKHCETDSG